MNNKQLAEMIKTLYKKKLEEQNPKAETSDYLKKQKFKPEHIPDNGNTSPNDYMHRMAEGMQQSTLGPHRDRKMNPNSTTLGNLVSRNRGGNQSTNKRYTPESAETDLGSTETGKKGKEAETVSVNPTDNTASATDPTNKNTTTREIKEKKNATMG